jgi:hypothetical protein
VGGGGTPPPPPPYHGGHTFPHERGRRRPHRTPVPTLGPSTPHDMNLNDMRNANQAGI